MAVTDQTPLGGAVGNGVTTIVPFDYYVAADADLVVLVDAVEANLNVDYTVTGAGNESGGQIVFFVAPTSGAQITHYRDTSLDRDTDYQTAGDLIATVLNLDIDRVWLALQEIFSGGKGAPTAIRMPPGETVPALPSAVARANTQLLFDSQGNPYTALPQSTSVAGVLLTLAASAGSSIIGFFQAGTGAVLRTVQAELRRVVHDQQYGALADGSTDDTTKIRNALTYVQSTYDPAAYASNSPANGSGSLTLQSGYFKLTDVLAITKKVAFVGDGPAEFSSGTRLGQFASNKDLIQVNPIVQGMSFSMEKMTLRSNTSGTGDLIHVTGALADCNSQRYDFLVLSTPQRLAMNIESGDDIMVTRLLVDVSAVSAIGLGTTTPADTVSNATFDTCRFFSVALRCFLLANVSGLEIKGASVYPSGSGRTQYFIDGTNTTPYQINNVVVTGGILKNVDCVATLTAVNGFTLNGLNGTGLGLAGSSTRSLLEFIGTCLNVEIKDCLFEGSVGAKWFADFSGGTVIGSITGCHFKNTGGGSNHALNGLANFNGTIRNNTFEGFTTPCVSQAFATTGTAIKPGTLGAGGSYTFTTTVMGARQGDNVDIWPTSLTDPVPNNIFVRAWVSASNTVAIKYMNPTTGSIGVPDHDLGILVTRG